MDEKILYDTHPKSESYFYIAISSCILINILLAIIFGICFGIILFYSTCIPVLFWYIGMNHIILYDDGIFVTSFHPTKNDPLCLFGVHEFKKKEFIYYNEIKIVVCVKHINTKQKAYINHGEGYGFIMITDQKKVIRLLWPSNNNRQLITIKKIVKDRMGEDWDKKLFSKTIHPKKNYLDMVNNEDLYWELFEVYLNMNEIHNKSPF